MQITPKQVYELKLLIENKEIPAFFRLLEEFGIENPQITQLKSQYVVAEHHEDFYQQLQVFVDTIPQNIILNNKKTRLDYQNLYEIVVDSDNISPKAKEKLQQIRDEYYLTDHEIKRIEEEVKNKLALEYYNKGYHAEKLQDKVVLYRKAIQFKRNYLHAYLNLANALAELGEYENAMLNYNQLVRLNPDEALVYFNRGNLKSKMEYYSEAVIDYKKAIEREEDTSQLEKIYTARGLACFYAGDYRNAVDDYSKVLKFNPKNAKIYYNRGLAYKNLKLYDNAIRNYQKAIELNPKYANAHYNLGYVYGKLNRFIDKLDCYTTAAELGHKLAQDWLDDI